MKICNIQSLVDVFNTPGKMVLYGNECIGYSQITNLEKIIDLKDGSERYRYTLNYHNPHYMYPDTMLFREWKLFHVVETPEC